LRVLDCLTLFPVAPVSALRKLLRLEPSRSVRIRLEFSGLPHRRSSCVSEAVCLRREAPPLLSRMRLPVGERQRDASEPAHCGCHRVEVHGQPPSSNAEAGGFFATIDRYILPSWGFGAGPVLRFRLNTSRSPETWPQLFGNRDRSDTSQHGSDATL
jgi:hypothetical protein